MIERKNDFLSLDNMFEMFITEKKIRGLASVTLDDYKFSYGVLKEYLGEKEINKLEYTKFVEHLMDTKNIPSVNRRISDTRVFLYWCMDNEYINRFKINKIKQQEEKIRFFTDEELKKLLVEPSKDCFYVEYRTWVMICFILATGCRISTLINIKIEDIDMNAKTIDLRHLKNKKYKCLPLVDSIVCVVRNYLRTWDITSEYLFCTNDGEKLTVNACEIAMSKYCKARKVNRRGYHALRHNFARQYIKNGGNAFTLQQMLCHSGIEMTRKYVKLFSEDIRNDVTKCNPLDTLRPIRTTIARKQCHN